MVVESERSVLGAGAGSAGGDDGAGPRRLAATGPTEGSSVFLGQASPHSRVLARGHGPFQTLPPNFALHADGLGRIDLIGRRAGGTDWEEEFWILVLAPGPVNPIHETTFR